MEDFFIQNDVFPYDEMLGRGGQAYLYKKFLNQNFSFVIYLQCKETKLVFDLDLAKVMKPDELGWLLDSFTQGKLTLDKKTYLLEDLELSELYTLSSKETKKSITQYNNDIEKIMSLAFNSLKEIYLSSNNEKINTIYEENVENTQLN